jgi:MFS family permease
MMSINPDLLTLLKNRNYRLLWTTATINNAAEMSEVLVSSWLVLHLTGSPFQVAMVGVSRTVSMIGFSLFAGAIGDRFNRRDVLLFSHAISLVAALGVLLILAFGEITPWHLFLAAGIRGTGRAFDNTNRRALVFQIVGTTNIVRAISLEFVGMSIGRTVGPLLTGVLLQVDQNAIWATGILVGGYILSLANLALLKVDASGHRLDNANVISSITEGFRYAIRSSPILAILVTTVGMNVLFQYQIFIPVIAEEYLGIGAALMGLLAASDGMGKVTGAIIMGAFSGYIRRQGLIFWWGSIGVSVCLLGFALSPWFMVSFLLLFLMGASHTGFATMQSSILLIASPSKLHGRMGGVQQIAVGAGQMGSVEIGALATVLTLPLALALNAIGGIVILLLVAVFMPVLRRPIRNVADNENELHI